MWYYYHDGQQAGPVPLETLQNLIFRAQLRPDDLIWREGMTQWVPIAQVPELASAMPPARPAASPTDPAQQPAQPAQYAQYPQYPQQAPIGYYTPTQDVVYAGFWIRFCAVVLDGIILGLTGLVLGVVIGVVLGLLMGASGAPIEEIEATAERVGNFFGILLNWLYYAFFESSVKQATPGKMAVGVVVTDDEGRRISFGRATGRHFAKILSTLTLLIGFIMAAFTERKKALHDYIAGTVVIYGKR